MRVHWIVAFVLATLTVGCQSPKKEAPTAPEKAPAAPTAPTAPQKAPVDPAEAPAAPAEAVPAAPRLTGAVATVNGETLDAEAFYAELDKVVKPGSKIPAERLDRIQANILTRLIDDKLVEQAIKREGVVVTDEEFAAEYARYKERFKTDEQYQNFLKYGRMTEEQVGQRVRDKAALKTLLVKKYGLGVTDEEIRSFYEKNNRFYKEREAVTIKQILVRLPKSADEAQTHAADEKIKAIQAALREKAFEDVAKEFSDDPSGKKGGEMEPITRGRYLKAIEDVAFTMKPNEISKPIRTQVGYHVIKLVERAEERMKSFDEVKGQIAETLSNRNFYAAKRRLTDELKKDATITRQIPDRPEAPPVTRSGVPAAPKPAGEAPAGE